KVGLLQLITLWPSPVKLLSRYLRRARRVFVVEHNLGQYVREIERACAENVKVRSVLHYDGSLITPEKIIEAVQGRQA
ncbi:MAG: 2-oxoacid:acceptor oxidoreductase subunit alpha, partial [Planctomycetota bacterium]